MAGARARTFVTKYLGPTLPRPIGTAIAPLPVDEVSDAAPRGCVIPTMERFQCPPKSVTFLSLVEAVGLN